MRVAVFVTPHGFGHAARASAVMDAVHEATGASFDIFTTVSRSFFDGLLASPFQYHPLETDVGLRQTSALEADLPATVRALDAFRSGLEDTVLAATRKVETRGCALILSDISPLGILVAEGCGIPSVLVENFTWDWIYAPLLAREPELARHVAWLAEVYRRAGHRFQAAPVSRKIPGAREVNPVGRIPRRSREEVRAELGLSQEESVTLLTLGGVAQDLPFLDLLKGAPGHFLVTGSELHRREGNVTFFSLEKPVYTPDLMASSDRVVAKLGYSTAVEAWLQDRSMAFVANPAFRDTEVLGPFVEAEMDARALSMDDFFSGEWLRDPWLREDAGSTARQKGAGAGRRGRGGPTSVAAGPVLRESGAQEIAEGVAELLGVGYPDQAANPARAAKLASAANSGQALNPGETSAREKVR